MKNSPLRKMPFPRAADEWLKMHSAYISPVTVSDYEKCIKTLKAHLGNKQLSKITIDDIRAYQNTRKVTAPRINKELSCLQQILKEADVWHDIGRHYRALKTKQPRVGQPLTPEQEKRLVNVVERSRGPQWGLAGHCLLLMANTTCGFGEIQCSNAEMWTLWTLRNESFTFATEQRTAIAFAPFH